MKKLYERIDIEINGIRYKTVPNANVICSSDGKMYRYTQKSSFVPLNLTEICKNQYNSNGYGYLQGAFRTVDGKFYQTSKHRIIAYAFGLIDNIHSPLDVDHINKITDDNRLENLRAIPHQENLKSRENGKRIIAKSKDNTIVLEFKSSVEASNYLINNGYTKTKSEYALRSNLCNALKENDKHRSNFAYGFYWTYKEV